MNPIITAIAQNRPNYCHALEVSDRLELESCLEALTSEFAHVYPLSDILDFFNTISVCCLVEDNEGEVYGVDVEAFILGLTQ